MITAYLFSTYTGLDQERFVDVAQHLDIKVSLFNDREPFFATKAPGKGSGLGSPQVHGIVNQHGGYLKVESEVDRGTTFHIHLPLQDTVASMSSEPQKGNLLYGEQQHIMVVEDNVILGDALKESLQQLNYRVSCVTDGQAALQKLSEPNDIALVLTDMIMPVMGGLALLRTIRSLGWTLPVVVLTGHSLQDELESMKQAGAAAYLMKPPDIVDLARILYKTIQTSR